MITWTFEGSETFYKSKPENLDRDISKMALANKINPETKIKIIDGSTNLTLPTNDSSSDGDTGTVSQPALSMGTKKSKTTKHKTDELSPVYGDLDNVVPESDPMELPTSNGDSSESSDWFDQQRV